MSSVLGRGRSVLIEALSRDVLECWRRHVPFDPYPVRAWPVAVCRDDAGVVDGFMCFGVPPRVQEGLWVVEPIYCTFGRQVLRMFDALERALRLIGIQRYLIYIDQAHPKWLGFVKKVPEFRPLGNRSTRPTELELNWYERVLN